MTQSSDTTHLDALELRLSHERVRLQNAKTEKERVYRTHTVAMAEKEIAGELLFLGKHAVELPEMTIDEILAELEK